MPVSSPIGVVAFLALLSSLPPALAAVTDSGAQPVETNAVSMAGTWYEVAVECPFCSSFENQSITLTREATLTRYSDRLEISPSLKTARFLTRTQTAETSERQALGVSDPTKNRLVLIEYSSGNGERTSDMFARVWLLVPLGDGMLLYGRRYLISVFATEAFEPEGKGYHAQRRFLPVDRLLANLEDVRVSSLNEARKVYQPSTQVRFTLEGAVCFVRDGTSEEHVARAREQSKANAREHASREALFRTLVQEGDRAYSEGRYEDALNQYKAASAILPEVALVHTDLGAVYQVQNKLPEAESEYRLALELDPDDPDSQYNLALILEQSGKLSEALRQFRLLLSTRPHDVEAKEHAARLSERLGK